ncbi:MAG: FecR domain-containing protein [Burkholderiales bacterium]
MKTGFSAVRAIATLGIALCAFAAHGNGTVAQMSGTVSVQKPDGAVRLLSRQSEVGRGDTVNTERDSYAQVRFSDGAVMTLKPNTRIRIEEYTFDQAQPTRDNSAMALVKGGLRMITGLIGKRGNQDALRLGTATATIGIRGTTFSVDDCVTSVCTKRGATRTSAVGGMDFARAGSETMLDFPDATDDPERFQAWVNLDRMLNGTPRDPFALLGQRYAQSQEQCTDCLPPAVYVGVSDGEIVVANSSGNTNFRAGQFGSVASFNARPSTLPGDPGLPIYTPPTSFFQNISGGGVRNANTQCLTN